MFCLHKLGMRSRLIGLLKKISPRSPKAEYLHHNETKKEKKRLENLQLTVIH